MLPQRTPAWPGHGIVQSRDALLSQEDAGTSRLLQDVAEEITA